MRGELPPLPLFGTAFWTIAATVVVSLAIGILFGVGRWLRDGKLELLVSLDAAAVLLLLGYVSGRLAEGGTLTLGRTVGRVWRPGAGGDRAPVAITGRAGQKPGKRSRGARG